MNLLSIHYNYNLFVFDKVYLVYMLTNNQANKGAYARNKTADERRDHLDPRQDDDSQNQGNRQSNLLLNISGQKD